MDYEEDILVELSVEDLAELARMYNLHEDELPHLYSFLKNCVQSKKKGMPDFVKVFSPRDCWREDGTFIASLPNHGHHVVLHSLDPTGKNLIQGLAKTQRFKFLQDPATSFTYFYAVHGQFKAIILEVLTKAHKQEITNVDELYVWCLEKTKGIKFNIGHPPDVYVKELEPEDIPTINSIWPFRYPTSELKLLDCLKLNKGFGVYLKSSKQLVSWVAPSCLGQMTALQTQEAHKKKGYGRLAVMSMAKYLAGNGFGCFGTVIDGNTASEVLLEKLGFTKRYKCLYILTKANVNM